jgi:transcriptional pleiotropic regulator of transition state genes
VIKKIDNLGRVVVPKGYRLMLGLKPGDPLDVEVDGDHIIIAPHKDGCTFCGETDAAQAYLSKSICSECLEQIRDIPIV